MRLQRRVRTSTALVVSLIGGCLPSSFDDLTAHEQSEAGVTRCEPGDRSCDGAVDRDGPPDVPGRDAGSSAPPAAPGPLDASAGSDAAPSSDVTPSVAATRDAADPPAASASAPEAGSPAAPPAIEPAAPPPDPPVSMPTTSAPAAPPPPTDPVEEVPPRALWPDPTEEYFAPEKQRGDVYIQICAESGYTKTAVCRPYEGKHISETTKQECLDDFAFVCKGPVTRPLLFCDRPARTCVYP